jgi:glycosyltransferase involved in cell wall biosynthesis
MVLLESDTSLLDPMLLPPTVSVIVPCYNHGQFLDEAVNSVLAQTFQDVEIIIVNDGSTEPATLELLTHYCRPKTKILHTANQGLAAARNAGIAEAGGKYILPLDADDRIAPTYLEKVVRLLDNDGTLGIVYCEAEFFGAEAGRWDIPDYSFPAILMGNVIFCSALFRREDWKTVGGYNPNMIHGWEDYDFWLSLIELGRGVFRIPEVLFYYRRAARSMSKEIDAGRALYSYVQLFKNHTKLYSDNIEALFAELLKLQDTTWRLEDSERRRREAEDELVKAQQKLFHAERVFKIMDRVGYWKVRELWQKVRGH